MVISSTISFLYILLLALFCVNVVNNASIDVEKYKKFVGDQGLYKEKDDVEILSLGNFRNAVFGSEQAWHVEVFSCVCVSTRQKRVFQSPEIENILKRILKSSSSRTVVFLYILFLSSTCVNLVSIQLLKFKLEMLNKVWSDQNHDKNPEGLYNLEDHVAILSGENFKYTVFESKKAWFVEFYNSYCGFCQKFAPNWKKFATSVRNWRDLVKVAAIDCAVEANTGLCREFEVMGYPTLRYFHENYQEGVKQYGAFMDRGTTEDDHRNDLLNKIFKEQLEGRAKQFPKLLPHNHTDVDRVFDGASNEAKYGVLIVQDPTSHIGMEITLDLHRIPEIVTRYSYSNNTELVNRLGAVVFPSVYIITRNKSINENMPNKRDREGIAKSILDYLKLHSRFFEDSRKDSANPQKDHETKKDQDDLIERVKKMGDVVFQMDLETALRYSLKREVGGSKDISGERLEALIKYLHILQKHFPFGRNGKILLSQINDYVRTANPVEGKKIFEMVKEAERDDKLVFSSPQTWLGCKGSKAHFRGYPCGLWKMFHYLVVNAADADTGLRGDNPKVALEAMHGYIKNFFGCTDCSQHFQDMAKRREMDEVSSFDDSIIWLWMAHNEVNKRLSGEITEDPDFPKIQFPSKERCPKCHRDDNDMWNYQEVLHYLKHMYSSVNVRYIGSDTRVIHLGLETGHTQSTQTEGLQTEDVQIQARPARQGVNDNSGAAATIKDKELMLFFWFMFSCVNILAQAW